jgi:hypothetical protein
MNWRNILLAVSALVLLAFAFLPSGTFTDWSLSSHLSSPGQSPQKPASQSGAPSSQVGPDDLVYDPATGFFYADREVYAVQWSVENKLHGANIVPVDDLAQLGIKYNGPGKYAGKLKGLWPAKEVKVQVLLGANTGWVYDLQLGGNTFKCTLPQGSSAPGGGGQTASQSAGQF